MAKKAQTTEKVEKKPKAVKLDVVNEAKEEVKVEEVKAAEVVEEEKPVVENAQVEEKPVVENAQVEEKPSTVEEAIEKVDTTIQTPENTELMKKLDDIITPVSEVKLEVKAITSGQKELEKIVNGDLEKAEKTLQEEVKKAKDLKNKLDKMINNTKKITNKMNVTSWWNGMGYDF